MVVPRTTLATLRRGLLAWYRKHRRDLPWRAATAAGANPYHVFVSEAMLQQTQVATVIAYFNRFIEVFPTAEALANADEQRVLRLWQGLGYYRRARNLHAAAKVIVQEHGGAVPRDVESLLALPGVGRYTAGAVASIAFDVPAPILDGNVARVLARWFAIEEPIEEPAVRDQLWSLAEMLVPKRAAGEFNQAMMELGALVCSPRAPKCLVCPVAGACEAAKRQVAEELPRKGAKRAPMAVTHHVAAVERGGAFLFEQRPAKGLWSNMWQLPTSEAFAGEVKAETIRAWTKSTRGIATATPCEVSRFTHQTTHRTITFILWHAAGRTSKSNRLSHCWRALDAIDELPLPNPQRRAVDLLKAMTR